MPNLYKHTDYYFAVFRNWSFNPIWYDNHRGAESADNNLWICVTEGIEISYQNMRHIQA